MVMLIMMTIMSIYKGPKYGIKAYSYEEQSTNRKENEKNYERRASRVMIYKQHS